MHHQRHRRTCRQRLARGGGDGTRDAQGLLGAHHADRHARALPDLPHGQHDDRHHGATEQGRGRRQRLRARVWHPSGRCDQGRGDVRDHVGGDGRTRRRRARDGEALGAPRLPQDARRDGVRRARRRRVQRALHAVQVAL